MTDESAMHEYMIGLKPHILDRILITHPDTFEALVLDAEKADQSFMMHKELAKQPFTKGGRHRGNNGGNNRGGNW